MTRYAEVDAERFAYDLVICSKLLGSQKLNHLVNHIGMIDVSLDALVNLRERICDYAMQEEENKNQKVSF